MCHPPVFVAPAPRKPARAARGREEGGAQAGQGPSRRASGIMVSPLGQVGGLLEAMYTLQYWRWLVVWLHPCR